MDVWDRSRQTIAGWPELKDVPPGVRLNLGCGKCILPKEDGWINVDRLPIPGVDKQTDLFRFPWPWPDNSVDYIMASHIVEHIPHQVQCYYPNHTPIPLSVSEDWQSSAEIREHGLISPLDGFFTFFKECWRILKPSGQMLVLAPYGHTSLALQDPTHTRYIIPETFGYLGIDAGGDAFDYQLGFAFRGSAHVYFATSFHKLIEEFSDEQLQQVLMHTLNAGHTVKAELWPIKSLDKGIQIE